MFINKGFASGTLSRPPQKVAEGVVILTLRVRDDRVNPTTGKRDVHFPTFVVFGRESDKALKYLEKGQEVSIEYKLETRRKTVKGEEKPQFFEDKVATQVKYGPKRAPQPTETPKEDN